VTDTKKSIKAFFSSVKLTIFLLIFMALLFVLGTFLPQRESAVEFARHLSPEVYSVFQGLGLFDVYHSPIYYVLLSLLALNLTVCSLNRLPGSWKLYRTPHFPAPNGLFEKISPDRILVTDRPQDSSLASLESLLKEKYGKIEKEVTDGKTFFSIQRGGVSLFSVYAVHASILLMIAGALIGSIFGFEGYVNIIEGETTNSVVSRDGRGIQPLGFSVRCDKFTMEQYGNGMPKTYRSDLRFIKDGQVIRRAALLVNHPVSINGFRFYQSSYGTSPDSQAFLTYSRSGDQNVEMAGMVGDRFSLKGSNANIQILRIEEDLMELGPAVKLVVTTPQGHVRLWVFQHIDEITEMYPELLTRAPLFNPALFKPYRFSLSRIEKKYYTGLQVVRDPGVPLVAFGGFLMVAGLILRHFLPYRRIWIRVDKAGKQTRISFAGRSYRNQAGLNRELDRLCRRSREEGIA